MLAMLAAVVCLCSGTCANQKEYVKMDFDEQIYAYEYVQHYLWLEMEDKDRQMFLQDALDYIYRDICKAHPEIPPSSGL